MSKPISLLVAVCVAAASACIAAEPLTLAVQKPRGSEVSVRYRVNLSEQDARSAVLQLSFANVSVGNAATARLAASSGLTFAPGTVQQWDLLPGTSTVTVQLTVVGDGPQYVHVFTTQRGATSAVSVAVRPAGSRREAPAASRPTMDLDDPDNVIVLPVD